MAVSGQLHIPHLPNTRLGGPQRQSGRFEEQKHLLPLPGVELQIIQTAAHPENLQVKFCVCVFVGEGLRQLKFYMFVVRRSGVCSTTVVPCF